MKPSFHQFQQPVNLMVTGYDTTANRIAHVNPQGFYGFGGSTPLAITTGQLLSGITLSGRYHIPTPGIANSSGAPIGTRGLLDHQELGGGTQAVQRYTVTGQQGNGTALPYPQEWVRHRSGGTWSAWTETTNPGFHAYGTSNAAGEVTFNYPNLRFGTRPIVNVTLHTNLDLILTYQILAHTNLLCTVKTMAFGQATVGGVVVTTPPVARNSVTVYLSASPAS